MKSRFCHFVLIALSTFVLTACNWLDSSEVEVSTGAHFLSLTFTNAVADDVDVKQAKFKVVYDPALRDSFIVNVDSLPYNTAIDSVIPTFSFYSMKGTIIYRNDSNGVFKDSIYLTGKDTLDFRRVFKVKNFASDGKTSVTYRIKVNVHTQDPNLYQWKHVNTSFYSHDATTQKALYFKDKIFFFSHAGAQSYMNTSSDGVNWSSSKIISSLPNDANLQSMTVFGSDSIFMLQGDNSIYSSSDGETWNVKSYSSESFVFVNLLTSFNSKLWAIVQSKTDNKYRLASSINGNQWILDQSSVLNDNFPVRDFAVVTFSTKTNQPRIVIAGGYNKDGAMLDNVWSSSNGSYWVDFSTENKTFGKRIGTSLISYEGKLLSIGGVSSKGVVDSIYYIQSADDGLSWKRADTLMWVREHLHDTIYNNYQSRRNQSVLVDKNKYIYLIGGRDTLSNIHKDVWRGRLNKSVFLIKE